MYITYFIIAITCLISFAGFRDHSLIDKLAFWPYRVWRDKEWYRLISHGFIHVDIGHLFFNMFALYSFGSYMEQSFAMIFPGKGTLIYVLMYFMAIVVSDTINLFTKRDVYYYRSIGASGGVSAVVFSFILLNPFGQLGIMFIPIPIPAYMFGGLYLLYCFIMAKRGTGNVGHLAHFTGSLFGFFFPILLQPVLFKAFIDQVVTRI